MIIADKNYANYNNIYFYLIIATSKTILLQSLI